MPPASCACCWLSIQLHPEFFCSRGPGIPRGAYRWHSGTGMSCNELPLFRDAFTASATARAQATALVCGGQRLSYAQLAQRMQCIAATLHGAGVKPGDRVLLYLDNSIEF